jgi:hypothetical protein
MIGISKKVENAVISVLSAQTELESIEVIRGKEAVTHATFPRVVVTCKPGKALFPGMATPIVTELELLIQTEAKVDVAGDICEELADCAYSVLQASHGVPAVNAADNSMRLDKMEFDTPEEVEEHGGIMEFELTAEFYVSYIINLPRSIL